MTKPGQRLRAFREQLGLTTRDVVSLSNRVAAKHGSDNFSVPLSRLWDIETNGVIPNIYRLYSFSVIYHRSFAELLSIYGVDLNQSATDYGSIMLPGTHLTPAVADFFNGEEPRTANGFAPRCTTNVGSKLSEDISPLFLLPSNENAHYLYGYIGTEDMTMYPLLTPGAFVQIDESKNKAASGPWRSEHERPIYFVETREGFRCCWCLVENGWITLQPHPLSSVPVRICKYPQEAEIIGEVVAIVMRLHKKEHT
jgi:hypothetical protein